MPDRSVPPVPAAAVEDACRRRYPDWEKHVLRPDCSAWVAAERFRVRTFLTGAAPALYKQWGEQLVAEIRAKGAEDANLDEGFGGDLHECIADAAGNWSGEFWKPQDIADGCADYVADLLDGEETR